MSNPIGIERQGAVAVVTLENAKTRNALSTAMIDALAEALDALDADRECRVIVLTGAGGHFCSGGDVSGMTPDRALLGSRRRIERAHRIIRRIVGAQKPVIAAVEGYAFGAGLSLAAACDYVVSSSAAKYCAVFVKVGLIPDMGLLWTLPQRIGLGESKKMFMSGRTLEAEEALRLGLIDQLVEPGASLDAALQQASALAEVSPLAVALTKAAYARGCASLDEALRNELDHQPVLYLSQDHNDAVAAFREKRTPVFKGI
jgi:2-(1,2-epoxy-1,2-dihydrophenyl)acetyl-CoA isomerase